jgi:hypothetical protein
VIKKGKTYTNDLASICITVTGSVYYSESKGIYKFKGYITAKSNGDIMETGKYEIPMSVIGEFGWYEVERE